MKMKRRIQFQAGDSLYIPAFVYYSVLSIVKTFLKWFITDRTDQYFDDPGI